VLGAGELVTTARGLARRMRQIQMFVWQVARYPAHNARRQQGW